MSPLAQAQEADVTGSVSVDLAEGDEVVHDAACKKPCSASGPMGPGTSVSAPAVSEVVLDCGVQLNAQFANCVICPLLQWSVLQWQEETHCEPDVQVSSSSIDEIMLLAFEKLDKYLKVNGAHCLGQDFERLELFIYAIAKDQRPDLP